ncbi:MAG: hypothetical protein R3C68_17345 [Myxococcota bacterium]
MCDNSKISRCHDFNANWNIAIANESRVSEDPNISFFPSVDKSEIASIAQAMKKRGAKKKTRDLEQLVAKKQHLEENKKQTDPNSFDFVYWDKQVEAIQSIAQRLIPDDVRLLNEALAPKR